MERDWEPDMTPLPIDLEQGSTIGANYAPGQRLDSLLPTEPETGAVEEAAFRAYLGAMMEMASRQGQKLSLLHVAADDSSVLRFLGEEGGRLIGKAMARCLRQETRIHDVIGCPSAEHAHPEPGFLIAMLLMNEEQVAPVAERLRETMTAHASGPGAPWLTISIGIATISLDTADPLELIARASSALRQARRSGGGRVWLHTDSVRRFIEREEREAGEQE